MFDSLLPTPLHPAVVHLPIALTVLLPLFAIGASIAIGRGARPRAPWGVVTAVAAALALSSWFAVETGEDAEEEVERIVAEAPLETHEEAADRMLWGAAATLGITAVGLFGGRAGAIARVSGTVATIVLVAAAWQVGHSGGVLVYTHGAATAYTTPRDTAPTPGEAPRDDRR